MWAPDVVERMGDCGGWPKQKRDQLGRVCKCVWVLRHPHNPMLQGQKEDVLDVGPMGTEGISKGKLAWQPGGVRPLGSSNCHSVRSLVFPQHPQGTQLALWKLKKAPWRPRLEGIDAATMRNDKIDLGRNNEHCSPERVAMYLTIKCLPTCQFSCSHQTLLFSEDHNIAY